VEFTDDQLCLIALCATDGVGPVTVGRLRASAQRSGMALRDALSLPEPELLALGLTPQCARAVAQIRAPLTAARALLERLDRLGGRPVLIGTPGYPARLTEVLGPQAPAVLFILGEPSLLHGPTVAIVGSRRPSRDAARAARALAASQARAGAVVVSGGALGIDTVAHTAAVTAGATVVAPPVGLGRFRWHGMSPHALRPGSWCVAGQFPPSSGWRSEQALMRNRTVVALSDAIVAFEPRDVGGTWHACINALRLGRPLFVVTAADAGARARGRRKLVRMGAAALDPARMPNPEEFARMVADFTPPAAPEQTFLFGPGDRWVAGAG